MNKLMVWLEDEALTFRQMAGYVLFAALFDLSMNYTVRAALLNWRLIEHPPYDPNPQNPFMHDNLLDFVSTLVMAPILEETIFRVVPLLIVIFFTKRPTAVFGAVVVFAILFGAIHPYGWFGKTQVAIAGFTFGVIYLKCGGLKGNVLKAALCAMATHSMANAFLYAQMYYEYLERVL